MNHKFFLTHVLNAKFLASLWKSIFILMMIGSLGIMYPGAQALAQPDCGPGLHWIDNCPGGTDSMMTGALVGVDLTPYDGNCFREINLVLNSAGPVSDVILRSPSMDDITNPNILSPLPDFPAPSTDGHFDVIETEMLSLDLVDGSGAFTLKAGAAASVPLPPTLGAIIENPGNPAEGNSYFDVFFEIMTPCGPLYNHQPFRVKAVITEVAPEQAQYFHPTGICLDLFTTPPPLGFPVPIPACPVAQLVDALHLTQAEIILGCTDPQASNFNPAATVDDGSCCYPVLGPGPGWLQNGLPAPGFDEILTGAIVGINLSPTNCFLPPNIEVPLIGPTFIQRFPNTGSIPMEIVGAELTSPDGDIKLRIGQQYGLPPTLGQVIPTPDPFIAESFFDVFFEVELPGGVIGRNPQNQPLQLVSPVDQIPPQTVYQPAQPNICIPILDPAGAPLGNVVVTQHFTKIIPGCTDPTALNFNPSATFDDGSCTFLSCPPPGGLNTVNVGPTSTRLRWNPVFGANTYTIRGFVTGAPGSVSLTVSGCEFLVNNLLQNAEYWWQIQANCGPCGGNSPYSQIDTFVTGIPCVAPDSIWETISGNNVLLQWNPSPNSIGYVIEGGPASNPTAVSLTVFGGASSSLAVSNLAPGTYQWRIRSGCSVSPLQLSPFTAFNTFTVVDAPAKAGEAKEFLKDVDWTVTLYPNPTSEDVRLTFDNIVVDSDIYIEMYDMSGQMVVSKTLNGMDRTTILSTEGLSNGIYQVMIKNNETVKVEKLIIAK